MTDDEKKLGAGSVLLSFLAGAALGAGLALLLAPKNNESEEHGDEEGPLFI